MFPVTDWVIYASGVVATGTYTLNLQVSDRGRRDLYGHRKHDLAPSARDRHIHIPIDGDVAAFFDNDSKFVRVNAPWRTPLPALFGSFLTKPANKAGLAYKPGDLVSVA